MTLDVDIREPLDTFTLKVKFSASAGLIALLGPSGSGKTTTLNVLAGIRRPEYARVLFDNDVIVDTERGIWKAVHTRRVGYVFQDSRLFPHMTVRHNLRFGRWFNRKHKSDAISEAHLVELLGLGPLLGRTPPTLSGGERRRVALGRALLANPRLLLLDEPMGSLDHARRQEILPYLDRLLTEVKLPMIYVTHDVGEVQGRAARVITLKPEMDR